MAKPVTIPKTETKPGSAEKKGEEEKTSLAYTIRETIESIVIAFVLAFLFRTFEAEAFVIPTGSMAPTLQGRHKDVVCPECGYAYRVSASSEVNDAGDLNLGSTVVQTTCPNCRFAKQIETSEDPSYNGDRILVGKFPYDFSEPKRWDVIVFKYPGDAKMNYIKRLVGLPGEKLAIQFGDLFLRDPDKDEVNILRKPPDKVRAMAQLVYDNDFVVDAMTEKGWPLRWQPWSQTLGEKGDWTTADGGRSFLIEPAGDDAHWLRYQHFPPSQSDWRDLDRGAVVTQNIRPQLITDFYAYNTNLDRHSRNEDRPNLAGMHWVGDLMLDCQVNVKSDSGAVLVDVVRGGAHFVCEIDVASGKAALRIPGDREFAPRTLTGTTKLKGPGKYDVVFANFDHQLTLWVGGKLVEFDGPTEYDIDVDMPRSTAQDAGDLAPLGVGARGVALEVMHLKVKRDIYYIAQGLGSSLVMTDFRQYPQAFDRPHQKQILSDPSQWGLFAPDNLRFVTVDLEDKTDNREDQFFVLGDNSPFSKDARLWEAEPHVKRELLIGKALYIYWPHSFDRVPGTKIPFPFFPNFGAMGFVR
jgi:signal peptidase I